MAKLLGALPLLIAPAVWTVLLLTGPAARRPPYRLASGRLRAGDRAAAGALVPT
jgi:hypothetical protein